VSEPLKPWEGPEDAAPEDEPQSGYLLMAGVLCGLIIAIGSQALKGHFAQRPELAAADPLMVQAIGGAFWLGWGLAGACLAAWLWQLSRK
jgi:hypothetical protein